jgi:PAS domain S-box-containing protein
MRQDTDLDGATGAHVTIIGSHHSVPANRTPAQLLVRALADLTASLDYEDTLRRVSSVAVPAVADYCIFDLLGPGGRLQRVGWSHVDPRLEEELGETILRSSPPPDAADHPVLRALHSGEVVLEEELDDRWATRVALDARHLEALRRLAPTAVMYVPLIVQGSTIGVLVLAVGGERRYSAEDVAVARELAAQAVAALERAALYREVAAQKRILEAQGEASVDGMLVVSPEGRILSSNRRFTELLGIAPDVIAGGDDEAALAAAQRVVKDPEGFIQRIRELYASPDTSARDIVELADRRLLERNTSPVRGDDGRLLGRLWAFRDVTAEQRSAEALRYQNSLTRTILENAQFGVLLLDERGHPTYANEAWTRITGFELAEMRGRPAHDSVHHHRPDGTPFPIRECPIDRALPERRMIVPYEDWFVRKDGSFFPVRAAASPILRDGVPVGTVVEVQDITEERRTEAALLALTAAELDRAAKLNALVDGMREAVIVVEADGAVSIANGAATDLLGRQPASIEEVARSLGIEVPVLARARSGTLPPTIVRLNGPDERWIEIRGYGTRRGGAGSPPSQAGPAIYLLRDVTDEQRAQALRERFVDILSHELRTPVTTIYGGSRLLARSSLPAERIPEITADIVAEADRLHRLIENLVVMTKAREHALDVGLEPIQLHRLVAHAVALEQERWADVRCSVTLPPDTPPVTGDPTSIEQIVTNLVGNAAKYGGGRIEIRIEAGEGEVIVRVLDDGPGIDPDALGRVFDLFYRAPDAERRASGAGIGLFVSRHLVEAMGGRIWAANRPHGAEFGFALPVTSES